MLLDRENTYSINQAVTTTAVSTDIINHRGQGELNRQDLRLYVSLPVAFAGGTSIDFQFQTAAAESFASPVTLFSTGAIALANLTAGRVIADIPFPANTLQFTRWNYVVVGTMTAGQIDAAVVGDSPNLAIFPDAVDVY